MNSIDEHNSGEVLHPSSPMGKKESVHLDFVSEQWNRCKTEMNKCIESGAHYVVELAAPLKNEWSKWCDSAAKIYFYALDQIIAQRNQGGTETDQLVQTIAFDDLPKTLNEIIIKAIRVLNMQRVLTRYPEFKNAYEGVSRYAYKYLIRYASGTISFGLDNLVKALQNNIISSSAAKQDRLINLEKSVFSGTAEALAKINEAYSQIPNIEILDEADQTYQVIQYLKNKGELHNAIVELTLEEERLWAKREAFLKPGEDIYAAILRLEQEGGDNHHLIETLLAMKEIEIKIWEKERKFIAHKCEKIFDTIAFPGNSFYEQLPFGLKPFHKELRSQILIALEASLSSAVDYAVDPATIYDLLIQAAASKGEGIWKSKVEEMNESSGRLFDLAKEVSRIGLPALTEAGECVHYVAEAANTAAYGAAGLVEYGLELVEDLPYLSWFAKPAKAAVQQMKEAVVTTLDPNYYLAQVLDHAFDGLHQQLLQLSSKDGVKILLVKLTGILNECSKPTPPSTEEPGAQIKKEQEHKQQAIQAVGQMVKEAIGEGMAFDTLSTGVEPIITRFSNKRLNRQLFFAGVWEGLDSGLGNKNLEE